MKQLIFPMTEQYEEYLMDEARFSGYARSISFPESEEDILAVLAELRKEQIPVTMQGGKTSITGGAIPLDGHIMNLSHMNHVKGSQLLEDKTGLIAVEPGITLMDLKKEIDSRFRKNPLFWPPDPTETSATVGGIAAVNAQGITRLLYGDSRNYIEGIRLINYDGEIREIKRGEQLTLSDGSELELLDAVLGKEGITGIISELVLKLIPKPESVWGIAFFFEQEEDAGQLVEDLKKDMPKCEDAQVAAVEYIDRRTMNLIEQRKDMMTRIKDLPAIPESVVSMIYIEIHGKEDAIEAIAESLMEMAVACESDLDQSWAVTGETEVEKMHAFRHGAAETVNLYVEEARRADPRITKLGMDMSMDNMSFSRILFCCKEEIEKAGLKGCIFGHALENHLHVNLLPSDYEEYERAIELIQKWAKEVQKGKGKVIGEHGVGKLKRKILGEFVSPDYIKLCQELKMKFDHAEGFNKENIFS